jgi:hypothetical protein
MQNSSESITPRSRIIKNKEATPMVKERLSSKERLSPLAMYNIEPSQVRSSSLRHRLLSPHMVSLPNAKKITIDLSPIKTTKGGMRDSMATLPKSLKSQSSIKRSPPK